MSESRLPSSVEYASFLVYNPRPTNDIGERALAVRDAVKKDTAAWASRHRLGARLRDEVGEAILEKFLSPTTTLVPAPGHARLKDPNSRWSARDLCREFVANGVGRQWLPLLEREFTVQKSAWASKEELDQITPQVHFDSLKVHPDLTAGSLITVVDDIVTAGKTLFGCVAKLQRAYPNATVRAFALVRTMSDDPIEKVKSPIEGAIRLTSWGTRREP